MSDTARAKIKEVLDFLLAIILGAIVILINDIWVHTDFVCTSEEQFLDSGEPYDVTVIRIYPDHAEKEWYIIQLISSK